MPISEVYNEDCMIGMSRYPDKYFDLAIVDPPYGIGISNYEQIGTSKKHKIKTWDNQIPTKEYFDELKRLTKNQIIWGVNYFDGFGLNGGRIVWNKLGTSIGHRENPPSFSDCELAYCSVGVNIKMFSYTYIGNVQGNNYQILWSKTDRIHPTQKPVQLYKWLLRNYAKLGDKILDTHLGSGSSRIACFDGGFDFVGFEIDKDYYEAQEKRFQNHILQQKLF